MRVLIVVGLCLATVVPAAAQRPATFEMSCGEIQALLSARGRAVLQTSPTTYDRYVADGRFCQRDEFPEPAWAPSADGFQCSVGFRCRARSDRTFR